MATSSVNSASDIFAALNGKRSGNDTSAAEGTQDRFLKLLVTQLQNQDPLNPLDNAAVTTQLSQISTVTGIEKVNETLASLLSSYSDSQNMQAASLIGKNVLSPGASLKLAGGQAAGGVDLAAAADQVRVSILDSSGAVLQVQTLGARPAGSFAFVWDGKTDQGASVPAGNYRFSVSAVQAGERVTADPLQLGTVSALVRGKGGFELELGTQGRVDFAKVQQIF